MIRKVGLLTRKRVVCAHMQLAFELGPLPSGFKIDFEFAKRPPNRTLGSESGTGKTNDVETESAGPWCKRPRLES